MKLKWLAGPVLAALLLSGCDHHRTNTNAAAGATAPRADSEYTGSAPQPVDSMKSPPRATLVALPGHPIPASALSAPPPVAPVPTLADAAPSTPSEMPEPVPSDHSPADTDSAPPPTTNAPLADDTASATPGSVGSSGLAPSMNGNPTTADPHGDVAVIQTSLGKIVIELDDFAAPKTCKNFRELIADGFYNNTVFHRVIPNFIIQGGDPKSKSVATDRNIYGLGSPGYTLPPEIELKHDRGAVAMARLPDSLNPKRESNGSQFYICLVACPSLDDQYTVFGHVIQGLDVANKIATQPRDTRDNPLQRIEMTVSLEPRDEAIANASSPVPQ